MLSKSRSTIAMISCLSIALFGLPAGSVWAAEPYSCAGEIATIVGTAGDDILVGTAGDDVIVGRGGNDVISSGAGNDIVCGDSDEPDSTGDDTIDAGDGEDYVEGGPGNDHLTTGHDGGYLDGGPGNDVLTGGAQYFAGGEGDDIITGDPLAAGSQYFDGGPGADELTSVRSADVIPAPGSEIFDGDYLDGGEGNDILDAVAATWAYLDGGDGDDLLRGGASAQYLDGGSGNDTLSGGAPYLEGGDGDDTLTGDADAPAPQYFDGGPGDDSIVSKRTTGIGDTLDGGDGNDVLTGAATAETLFGGDGDDFLIGNGGADVFIAGGGHDTLQAIDGGADTFFDCGGDYDVLLTDTPADDGTPRFGCEFDPNAPPSGGGGGPGGGGAPGDPLAGDFNGDGRVRWAILGDSYISGEGLTDPAVDVFGNAVHGYLDHTDTAANHCHRSVTSWAYGLARTYGATDDDILFAACSGAVTANLDRAAQYSDSPHTTAGWRPQLADLNAFIDEERGGVDAVLISIGGNDAGFEGVITNCLLFLCNPRKDADWRDKLAEKIKHQLFRIRATAPGARIFIANYVNPINPPDSYCPNLGEIGEWERRNLTRFIETLNSAVAVAAHGAGADLINLEPAFRNHGICDADPWAHGLTAGRDLYGFRWNKLFDNFRGGVLGIAAESFHPTDEGHAHLLSAAAQQVAQKIQQSAPEPQDSDPIELPPDSRVSHRFVFDDDRAEMILQYYPSQDMAVTTSTFSVPTIVATVPVQAGVPIEISGLLPPTLAPGWHLLEIADTETGRVDAMVPYYVPWPDSCPDHAGSDVDGDGYPDTCDGDATDGPLADVDEDAVTNGIDNCIVVSNTDQADTDDDGIGDACDPDQGADPFAGYRTVVNEAPPSVDLVTPGDGATVAGVVPVTVSLAGEELWDFDLRVDSTSLHHTARPTAGEVTVQLDTTTLSNGAHTLQASATDILGNTATLSATITVNNAPATPYTTTTVTLLPGTPAKVQVDVRATPSTQAVKGTAKVSFYRADGTKKTDKSASLKNGTVQINLPTDFPPGVYTVIAEYKPGSGGGPASTSEPVLWVIG